LLHSCPIFDPPDQFVVMRDNVSPDKILRFSQLYSRLLTEPVLQQKWAVLYLLYQLADTELPDAIKDIMRSSLQQNQDGQPTPEPAQREFVVDSPAFNQAFSSAGLLRLPTGDEPRLTPAERPVSRHREKKDRTKDKPTNGDTPVSSPVPQTYITYDTIHPTEPALLRDLPFVLQGLSSTNLVFSSSKTLQLPKSLPVPLISLLHTLAEPCLLYKSLSEFVESEGGGLVSQSFRSALGLELRSYLKLVATLEGQIRRALAMLDDTQPKRGIGKAGVTLKRCVYWTREATMGLRLMSLMVEESKRKYHEYGGKTS
jgi:gamma-tubulin complex component 3